MKESKYEILQKVDAAMAECAQLGDPLVESPFDKVSDLVDSSKKFVAGAALAGTIATGTQTLPAAAETNGNPPVVVTIDHHGDTLSGRALQVGADWHTADTATPDMVHVGDEVLACAPGQAMAHKGDTVTAFAPRHQNTQTEFLAKNPDVANSANQWLYEEQCYWVDTDEREVTVHEDVNRTVYEIAGGDQKLIQAIVARNNLTMQPNGVVIIQPGQKLIVPTLPTMPNIGEKSGSSPTKPLETNDSPSEALSPPPEVIADPVSGLNIEAIPEIKGVESQLIKDVVTYLIKNKGLTPMGAAYLTGNFLQESSLNPSVRGDHGSAHGIGQWRGGRGADMPKDDLFAQIDFALDTEMGRDGVAADLPDLLRNPNATEVQIMDGLKRWERWGEIGSRSEYGRIIHEAITASAASNNPEGPESTSVQPETLIPSETAEIPDADLSHHFIDLSSRRSETNGVETIEVDGIRINVEIAPNLARMLEAAANDGLTLSVSSSFRSNAEQARLRVENGCEDIDSAPPSSCRVPTAIPGTSNHEKGLAIDFNDANGHNDATYKWLAKHGAEFGFYNLPSEPWHWSKDGH